MGTPTSFHLSHVAAPHCLLVKAFITKGLKLPPVSVFQSMLLHLSLLASTIVPWPFQQMSVK
jgi:hypothetical protein